MTNILIQNGQVVDTVSLKLKKADVRVRDEKIVEVGPKLKPGGGDERVVDAKGLLVSPGLVDIHVHLREPGDEDEETVASGAAAALAGGFTDIACMPNTTPALDNEAAIEFVFRQAFRAKAARVWPVGAITKERAGKELAEYAQMVRGGAVAFSDDGAGIASAGVMAKALKYMQPFERTLIQHCEEPTLAGGVMHGGFHSTRLGLPGVPALAEELMIRRDIALVRSIGGRYHVAHISTKVGVERVREAKKEGLHVTTEVCPHHLLLTDEAVSTYDTNYKMSPPLRSPEHVAALFAGLKDGTIDCLVTDHAPHRPEEKEVEFLNAPFGIIGLECSLGLFAKALVHSGRLSWPAMLAKMTDGPRDVIGRPRVAVAVGQNADLTLIDPAREWTVDVSTFRSKSRNCPYDGWQLKGRPVMTILEGKIKFEL
ncbi:MAG: dihydroorotase [Phycisphaerae bacterium]|nr:dihydroorotase [Phycisphaerae bacterium]